MADHGGPPFPGENYLRLLADAGMGTNDAGRIEVRVIPLKEATHFFSRKPTPAGAPDLRCV